LIRLFSDGNEERRRRENRKKIQIENCFSSIRFGKRNENGNSRFDGNGF
jgi:hypothetical protein